MMLKKYKLKKIILEYLNENNNQKIPELKDIVAPLNISKGIMSSVDRHQALQALERSGVLHEYGIIGTTDIEEVITLFEKQLISGGDSSQLLKQVSIISYLCDIYDLDPAKKAVFVKSWRDIARHIINPALPFAVVSTLVGKPGLSVALYFVMEIAWFIDPSRDLYNKLVKADSMLLDLLTLGTFGNIVSTIESRAKANADELILYSIQAYMPPAPVPSIESKSFMHNGHRYDYDGTPESISKAKIKLRDMFFDVVYSSIKSEIKNTLIALAAADPGEQRKKEMESMEKSGGKTDIKFNVLDRL